MTFDDYQRRQREAVKKPLPIWAQREHSLFGIATETGEIMDVLRRTHEGKPTEETRLRYHVGEMLGYISELCDSYGWEMDSIAMSSLMGSQYGKAEPGPRSRYYSKEKRQRRGAIK